MVRLRPLRCRPATIALLTFALVGAAAGIGTRPAGAAGSVAKGAEAPGLEVPLFATGTSGASAATGGTAGAARVIPTSSSVPEASSVTISGPAATFTINYDAGFAANPSAQAAFEAAVHIWAATLTDTVPIVIDARFTTSSCGGTVFFPGFLGAAGPKTVRSQLDFAAAPLANTYYPIALANALAGTDLDPPDPVHNPTNPTGADISAAFNQNEPDFYFGTDSNPPFDQLDFTSVVLHELGHGLGFIGSMKKVNATTADLLNDKPFVYDAFTTKGDGTSLVSLPRPSTTLMDALQSGDIWFRGPTTNAVTGPTGAKLSSPNPFVPGSSYSHLDEATFACAPPGPGCTGTNSLMTPFISSGEVEHHPGPIMLAMFVDMGWQLTLVPHFMVTATSPEVAGVATSVTVTATDIFGFTATSYAGTVHFSTTSASATLPADTTLSSGVGTFPATLRTAGNQTISATDTVDATVVGTSNVITVTPAAAQSFAVVAPSQLVAGIAGNVTVTALDAFGNTATGYAGTVHFTTSSAASSLPANSILISGVRTFPVTLSTFGSQTITATDTVTPSITGTSGSISVANGSGFHALAPSRILDTRSNLGITGPVGTSPRDLVVVNVGGVPLSGATDVVMNVTVTGGTKNSFLTVFPSGGGVPNASNLNYAAGETIPNLVVVKIGTFNSVSFVVAGGATDVVADVVGWYDNGLVTGDRYVAVAPTRILDTRSHQGITTGPVGTVASPLQIQGVAPMTSNVTAVVMNVTATASTKDSFLTVFPGASAQPTASNLNFAAGETIPNLVVVRVGVDGTINFVTAAGTTDVVADVVGYYSNVDPGGGFLPLVPSRILDTRTPLGIFTGPIGTAPQSLSVLNVGGIPASGVSAIVINVTVTGGTNDSFLTVFPGGTAEPTASNLNFAAGETIPNLVVVKVGPGGTINFANASGTTDVIADVVGWYTD